MKTFRQFTLCLALCGAGAYAQTVINTANQARTGAITVPSPTPYQVAESGPNYRIWKWQTYEPLPNGQFASHNHSYTELSSGLNFLDRTTGQWKPSQELIESYPQGAIAQQGQCRVIFANNLNTSGAIDEEIDGKRLVSNIIGLMYLDPTTGQSAQIAELKDSEGQLIANNQVLYPNAFDGVKADVRFRYRLDGMEQDVILKAKLPPPESVGLKSASAELVVITEFLNPPEASVCNVDSDAEGAEADQAVSWGSTILGRGRAFSLNGADVPAVVRKQYLNINGRYFLFEKVKYRDIQKAISSLPERASNAKGLRGMASKHLHFPKTPPAKSAARPIRLALGQMQDKGYVLDYISLNTAYTNYLFQGDTTYYVSGSLNLSGTNNVWEGGSVTKYAANASINLVPGSSMRFLSRPYHPVVFTAKDDNTVGQSISGSTGSPTGYYANPALNLSSMGSVALSEFRILYANRGLSVSGASPAIYDAQLAYCGTAISDISGNVSLENVLFSNIKTNFNSTSSTNTIYAQNATFNNAFDLNDGNLANTWLYATNCAFVNATNLSGNIVAGFNGFYQSPMVGSPAVTNTFYPLQLAGAASCYLTNGCTFLTNGTTGIDPYGLSLVHLKTVYAPLIYSNLTFSVATNFGQQVPRDTNAAPALGYHYDSLDYVFSGVSVYSNMTFSAGTAVGWFELPTSGGTGYGISIYDKVVLSFNGTASLPCTYARYCTVQEGGDGLWQNLGYMAGIVAQSLSGGYSMNPTNAGVTKPNFTRFALLAEGPNQIRENYALSQVVAQNSEFWDGNIGAYWDNLSATNCLFDRVNMGVGGGNPCQWWMRNCTVHGGSVSLSEYGQTWPVWIEDCAFDSTNLYVENNSGGNTNETYCDFNAFLTNATALAAPGTHNVIVTNFNWQSSWFGNFYLPTNALLIDHGSTTADQFGLYHFTTLTSQMKETNSIVDIGYHYVATDANGNPLDSNGDGIPDYLEDSNGNGLVDNGETNWALAILSGPVSQTVAQGSSATFAVLAKGVLPIYYQWYFNGTNAIPGATGSSLTLTNVQPSNIGSYSVVVSNFSGSRTSSTANLWLTCDVTPSGLLDWWPAESNAVDVVTGNSGALIGGVTFSSGVVGSSFSFDGWSGGMSTTVQGLNGNAPHSIEGWIKIPYIPSGRGRQWILLLGGENTGSHHWLLNPDGSTQLGIWNVVAATPVLPIGAWIHLAVTFDGTTLCCYTNGQLQSALAATCNFGTNSSVPLTLALPHISEYNFFGLIDELSIYNRALSSNEVAQIYTASANGKCALAPSINKQPAGSAVIQGTNAMFTVTAGGATPLSYQWYYNGTALTDSGGVLGSQTATLTLSNIQSNQAGYYGVIVGNAVGSVFSTNALLSVLVPATVTTQPANQLALRTGSVTFRIGATGTAPLSYQWWFNGTNLITGATNSWLTISNVQSTNVGSYSVSIVNTWGTAMSSNALLAIMNPMQPLLAVGGEHMMSLSTNGDVVAWGGQSIW